MAAPAFASTHQPTDSVGNDSSQGENNIHSSSGFDTPTTPLVQQTTNAQQTFACCFQSTADPIKSTLSALKTNVLPLAVGHPLTYIRVLMQMGYEPLPAFHAKTFWGNDTVYYPNAFHYLKHVYRIDGFTGLYRGFGCSLVAKVVYVCTTAKVAKFVGPVDSQQSNNESNPSWNKCIQKTLSDINAQSWGVLISHPFHVMAIRCMGQFIGREQTYSSINIFQNLKAIYEHEGIGGFFVGLIPRWLLETSTVIIANTLIYLLKTYLSSQNEMESLYEFLASYVAQTVNYPFNVLTTVTAINKSGLRAGMPSIMPIYANWHDAFLSLKKTDQLKRGSSLVNRPALGSNSLSAPGARKLNA